MVTVSYGMKIKNENHIFDKTIEVYRDAVKYLANIVLLHYDTISERRFERSKSYVTTVGRCLERCVGGCY
ncbi:MAG: hypothetical protein SO401_00325 [Blautia sp.]|nr:hypothetical protein [Blautia sp.]